MRLDGCVPVVARLSLRSGIPIPTVEFRQMRQRRRAGESPAAIDVRTRRLFIVPALAQEHAR